MTEADAAIITRVRAGDREAYAELVRRHAPVALRTAALLGAGPDAEDVVQEAFVKAYAQLRVTWAHTERLLASAEPLDSALSSERRRELVAALRMLPERDRQVVVCRYLLDLSEGESATVLGWPRPDTTP
jgi:DNA-directed RNA polymerase specialized sigma24 family protein